MEFLKSEQDIDRYYTASSSSSSALVLFFSASWCKSCEKLASDLSNYTDPSGSSSVLKKATFKKIDVDDCPDLSEKYNVTSLPTLLVIDKSDGRGYSARYSGSDITQVVALFDASSASSSASPDLGVPPKEPVIPLISTDLNLINLPKFNYAPDSTSRSPSTSISIQLLNKINLGDMPYTAKDMMSLNTAVSGVLNDSAVQARKFSVDEIQKLYVYKVPTVSPDGTCSNVHQMAIKPFNLASDGYKIAGIESTSANYLSDSSCEFLASSHPLTMRLFRLNVIVEKLYEMTNADWIGIYRLISVRDDDSNNSSSSSSISNSSSDVSSSWTPCLMKEAYRGEPSRALFPVTEPFAKKSTNSWVGLTGMPRIISNTRKREEGVSYYECSGSVQSELCVPILRFTGGGDSFDVIGIIDLESWKVDHFDSKKILNVLQVALDLGNSSSFFV